MIGNTMIENTTKSTVTGNPMAGKTTQSTVTGNRMAGKTKTLRILMFLYSSLFASSLFALSAVEKNTVEKKSTKVLTLQDFILLAEKNDPKYKEIFSELERLKHIKDEGLPSRKVDLNIIEERGYSLENNSSTSILRGELSKEFIESGTKVLISQSKIARTDRTENITEFRVEQSLYKNIFGRDVRLKKSSLIQREELGKLIVLEEYENYLLSLFKTYLNYKKIYLDVQLSKKIYQEAKKLERNVRKRRRSKIATKTDLNRSSLLVLLIEEDLLSKKKQMDVLLHEMNEIVGKKINSFTPSSMDKKHTEFLSIKNLVKTPKESLRSVIISNLQVEVAKKSTVLEKNKNDISLNLIAGYNRDDSERFSLITDRSEAIVGLKLNVPLGDTKASAATKIAFVEEHRAKLRQRKMLLSIDKKLSDLESQVFELKNKIKINEQKVLLTKNILKDERNRYQYGKINLDRLIETSNNYAAYRFELQSSIIEFNKLILEWYAFNDKLIDIKNKGHLQ